VMKTVNVDVFFALHRLCFSRNTNVYNILYNTVHAEIH
jgi:hypothetical protein